MTDPRKTPFRTPLSSHGLLISRVAHSRIRITAARLLVLNAAQKIDTSGAKSALREIAEAKIFVPAMCLEVLDWAMQAHGAQGLCQDTPLAAMWANARTLRIVDGPDEVHEMQMGRNELKRGREVAAKIEGQKARAVRLLGGEGLPVGEGWIGEGRLKARL
jgi:acyl-CoA dehydrogenase